MTTLFSRVAWSFTRCFAAEVEQVHYVNEEYEEALKNYTMAVTLEAAMLQVPVMQSTNLPSRQSEVEFLASDQDCVVYRTCRAACYLKLGR